MPKYPYFLAGAAILLVSTVAFTQPSWAEVDTQVAEDGGVFRMPAGDFRTSADYRAGNHVIPLRSPTSDAELARLKASRASAGAAASSVSEAKSRALFTECITNAATGFAPSDIHGAAGPTNIVVVTNVDISVRNKSTCALVSGVSLKTFFNNFTIPGTQTLFDPRVLFDRLHSRCLVTVESSDSSNTDQFLYVAASTNSSCTSWRRIRFILSRVSPSAKFCKASSSDFYDFPNTGHMGTRMVVTSNNFPSAGGAYGTIMSIDLTALLGTATVNASCFRSGLPTNNAPAVVSSSAVTQMFILSPGSGSGSSVSRRRLNVSASGPSSDTLSTLSSISVTSWTAPPDAAQPNGQRLDSSDGRFASATKQIGSTLWNVHTINVGGFARFRLYKFSTSGTSPLFTFTPTTSTCSSADHLFNASVDTNSTAAGTLAFVTASRTCPSQASTGRAAHLIFRGNNSSSAGWVFTTVETSATNFATENGFACNTAAPPTKPRASCRWGDYSATQVDPSNTGRGWGFNQLVTGTSAFNWNTRAGLVGP